MHNNGCWPGQGCRRGRRPSLGVGRPTARWSPHSSSDGRIARLPACATPAEHLLGEQPLGEQPRTPAAAAKKRTASPTDRRRFVATPRFTDTATRRCRPVAVQISRFKCSAASRMPSPTTTTSWTRVARAQAVGVQDGKDQHRHVQGHVIDHDRATGGRLVVPVLGTGPLSRRRREELRVENAGIVVRKGEDVARHVDDTGLRRGLESGEVGPGQRPDRVRRARTRTRRSPPRPTASPADVAWARLGTRQGAGAAAAGAILAESTASNRHNDRNEPLEPDHHSHQRDQSHARETDTREQGSGQRTGTRDRGPRRSTEKRRRRTARRTNGSCPARLACIPRRARV